jgi:hypothetical protein
MPDIQLVSSTLHAESTLRSIELQQLSFPKEWHEPLRTLQSERSGRPEKSSTPAVKSLNAVLQVYLPDLLTLPSLPRQGQQTENAEREDLNQEANAPWLMARHTIPTDFLFYIFQSWLQENYELCESYSELATMFRLEDLQWTPHTFALTEETSANGTALLPSLAFKVLPSLLADLVVQRDVKLRVGHQLRSLAKVITSEGAELMTWPPVYHAFPPNEDGSTPIEIGYSYTIKMTLQTVIGVAEPRLHFHYGVRRWQKTSCMSNEGGCYLRRHVTTYIRPHRKWYAQQHESNKAFLPAVIETKQRDNQAKRSPQWKDLTPKIASRIDVAWPEAEELAQQPLKWLEGFQGIDAGIVISSQRKLPVGVGLGPDVCEDLTRRVCEGLADHLILLPVCTQHHIAPKKERHPLMKDIRDIPMEKRLAAFVASVGPKATIEIHWTQEAVRDMLFDRVLSVLTREKPEKVDDPPAMEQSGLPEDNGPDSLESGSLEEEEVIADLSHMEGEIAETNAFQHRVANGQSPKKKKKKAIEPDLVAAPKEYFLPLPGGGRLRIITRPLQQIHDPLPIQDDKQKKAERYQERASLITKILEPVQEPTLAFVELPNYRAKEMRAQDGRKRDPKEAMRLGMAHTGRLTQFVAGSPVKNLRERCLSAVRDGLRQFGYLPCPIGYTIPKMPLPDPLLVLGVWVIRITKRRSAVGVHLPVVVLLHTASHQVLAWLPHDGQIRPYHQALLEITRMKPDMVRKKKREEALAQVRQFLLTIAPQQGVKDIVAFTVAQNVRATWSGLANNDAPFDALRFERKENQLAPFSPSTSFRLVRLRTHLRNETPEWYVPGFGPSQTAQGVWSEAGGDPASKRLFYNIAAKPTSAGTRGKTGKQDDPGEDYRLSSVVEVMLLMLQEQDVSLAWAVLCDQWRKMGYLTNEMTLLPLPLEFARKMDEYAAVIGPWVFPDEEDEEEEEEEEEMPELVVAQTKKNK